MFKPTEGMVRAAENLFAAMANEQVIRPIVTGYQKRILEKHQFPASDLGLGAAAKAPEVIMDPARAWLMSDEDFAVYLQECFEARDAAGLKVDVPENCPLLVAEDVRIQASNALLEEMSSIENLKSLRSVIFAGVDEYNRAVDLCLKLLAPFVSPSDDILKRLGA